MGLILLDSRVIVGFLNADDALHEITVARLKAVICADGDWPKIKGLSCGVELLKPATRARTKLPNGAS